MNKSIQRLAGLCLLLLLSGCVEQTSPSPPPEEVAPPAIDPAFLEPTWTDCDVLISGAYYPSDLVEVREDPAWSPSEEGLTHIRLHGIDCQEFAWGTFRGPVRMLFEWGDETLPPEECLGEGESGTVQSLWVSDAGLAATLVSVFEGLPIHAAPIEVSGQASTYRWEWGEPGSQSSWLDVVDDPLPQEGPFPLSLRLYWFNESAVSFLDFEDDRSRAYNGVSVSWGNRLAVGHLSPPMVGSAVGGDYAALGERGHADALQGHVSRFADHFCTTEIQ